MCSLCEIARAEGAESPEFHALPVHPDYVLRKVRPMAEPTCPLPDDTGAKLISDPTEIDAAALPSERTLA